MEEVKSEVKKLNGIKEKAEDAYEKLRFLEAVFRIETDSMRFEGKEVDGLHRILEEATDKLMDVVDFLEDEIVLKGENHDNG